MTTAAVHLDRLQAGTTALLRALAPTATVVWAPSTLPRASAADLVLACRLLSGPDADPIGGAGATSVTLPLAATLQILDVTAGEAVLLLASGRRFEVVAGVGDDVTAVRDAMLVAIGDAPLVNATFTAAGADSIAIEALEFGDLYKLGVRAAPGLASLVVTDTAVGVASSVDVRSWVEIQAFSANRAPRVGAAAALADIRARARLPSSLEILDAYGLSFSGPPGRVVGLDGMTGPTWESRAAWTAWISQLSLVAEVVGGIERARATIEVRGGTPEPVEIDIDTDPG